MTKFVFAFDPMGFERTVEASDEAAARKAAWNGLSDDEQNALESFDCVDALDDNGKSLWFS